MSRYRDMAERSLDHRYPPPGHATYREPRMTADEWRRAYFVLADIALRQLDECRAAAVEPAKCLVCHEVIVHRSGDPAMHVGCSIADHTDEAVRIYGDRHPAVREAAEALRAALLAADPYAYTPGTAKPSIEPLREALERFTQELERDCSPLAEDPENSIDYGEGICDERGRIAGVLDSLLSPEAVRLAADPQSPTGEEA